MLLIRSLKHARDNAFGDFKRISEEKTVKKLINKKQQ